MLLSEAQPLINAKIAKRIPVPRWAPWAEAGLAPPKFVSQAPRDDLLRVIQAMRELRKARPTERTGAAGIRQQILKHGVEMSEDKVSRILHEAEQVAGPIKPQT